MVDDGKGVFIGGSVKIEGATEEVAGGISKIELLGGSGVTANDEKDATDAIGCLNNRRLDGAGLVSMFVGHFEGIVAKLVESVVWLFRILLGADVFIADIDRCAEPGEVDIDPIGVFGDGVEKAAIAGNAGIDGIVESVGIAGLIEGLVFVRGEVDLEIAFPFGGVGAVTGQQAAAGKGENKCKAVRESRHGISIYNFYAI